MNSSGNLRTSHIYAAVVSIALLLVIGLVPPRATAQSSKGISSAGRDFYVGFLPGLKESLGWQRPESDYILISTYVDNTIQVNYPTAIDKENAGQTIMLSAGMSKELQIDPSLLRPTWPGESAEFKCAHITSKFPISVQVYTQGSSTGSLYQAIPTDALGDNYVVAAYNDNPYWDAPNSQNRDSSSSEFMIIAPYDNTQVTFIPNSTTYSGIVGYNTGAGATGAPHSVTIPLNKGQIYLVRSLPDDIGDDLSGSTITSNRPIAVLGGQERAMVNDPSSDWGGGDEDTRNLAVEMMTPVESWGTEYPSIPTMPASSNGCNENGDGDLYRVFSDQPHGQFVDEWVMDPDPTKGAQMHGPWALSGPYQAPAQGFENITDPVDLIDDTLSRDASHNLQKFYALQYDYFQGIFPSEVNYRACEEMNLISLNHFYTSTLFDVHRDQEYNGFQFINVITNRDSLQKIFVTFNGHQAGTLQSYSPPVKQYFIPNHPELTGLTIKVSPGSYVINGNTPFACYSYGRTELTSKELWGYAAPTGQAYGSFDQPDGPQADVVPSCGQWNVTVHEPQGHAGIADIMLLDDPNGYYTTPGRQSQNCRMSPSDPPPFAVGDASVNFQIQVNNTSLPADAYIYVVDRAGNDTVIHLSYLPPQLALSTTQVSMPAIVVTNSECRSFTFHVTATGSLNSDTVTAALEGLDKTGSFTLSSTPTLPAALHAGDSVVFTACFAASDSNDHKDSVHIFAGCLDTAMALEASGLTPIIWASDHNFGNVAVGDTECTDIMVENRGKAPLILDSNWFLSSNPDYSFKGSFPITIPPGGTVDTLHFCFHPSSVGEIDVITQWGTNLPRIYARLIKDTTILQGFGTHPGLSWVRPAPTAIVECDAADTIEAFLQNTSGGSTGAKIFVSDVHLLGDTGEFKIISYETGIAPPTWQMQEGDQKWVGIQFKADLSQGYGQRTIKIVVNGYDAGNNQYTDTLTCVGIVRHSIVAVNPPAYDFGSQTPGAILTQTFTITNTGDTNFVFGTFNIDNPTFTIISGPQQGSILAPGATDTFTVQYQALPAGGKSVGNGTAYDNICSSTTWTLKGLSYLVATSETGAQYPVTYICHNGSAAVTASNIGTVGILLDSVLIADDTNGFSSAGDASQFTFSNGKQLLAMQPPMPLDTGATGTFPVLYTPTTSSAVQAYAIFYYEDTSKGQTNFIRRVEPINGTGYATVNTLSVRSETATNGGYTAATSGSVTVPVRLTRPFDSIAQIYGVEFTFRYEGDEFVFNNITPLDGLTPASVSKPVPDPADTRYDLITVHLGSTSPIEDSGAIANVTMTYVVAKDSITPFEVHDLMFLDNTGSSVCWVQTDSIPSQFYGTNLCGDATLRNFLKGGLPVLSIGSVIPNPVRQTAAVNYNVMEDGVPVSMQLYNALGEPVQTVVKDDPQSKGEHQILIDASGLPSGLYTIFLTSPGYGVSKQVLVTK